MPPLVSIIVPCYNGSRYIPGLVESLKPVLLKYPGHYEIIFVDDGSKDNSTELMRQLMPEAIIVRQENRGLSAARNAGVSRAQGEFLQLLDADDTIELDKLEVQASAACAEAADVVYSDWRLLTMDRGKIVRTETFQPAEAPCEMVEALLSGWYVPPVGYLFRRSAYLELGGCDENIKVWEDFDLFLRFAMAGNRHVYAPGIFSNYYRYLEVQSLARRDSAARALSRERILRNTIDVLGKTGGLTEPRRKAAARAFFGVLRTAGTSDISSLRRFAWTIQELDSGFLFCGTRAYRMTARLLGIVNAERLAVLLRRFKSGRPTTVASKGPE